MKGNKYALTKITIKNRHITDQQLNTQLFMSISFYPVRIKGFTVFILKLRLFSGAQMLHLSQICISIFTRFTESCVLRDIEKLLIQMYFLV